MTLKGPGETPLIPGSWGELLDKISILEIKVERIVAPAALANVRRELALLVSLMQPIQSHESFAAWKAALSKVNQQLWDIEDKLRRKERDQVFDDEFIALARAVYLTNDERAEIKRTINLSLGSQIVEEKQYATYRKEPPAT
jgi:hypothetical protein